MKPMKKTIFLFSFLFVSSQGLALDQCQSGSICTLLFSQCRPESNSCSARLNEIRDEECLPTIDRDGDRRFNTCDNDMDGDGLSDLFEVFTNGTDAAKADTDSDGSCDGNRPVANTFESCTGLNDPCPRTADVFTGMIEGEDFTRPTATTCQLVVTTPPGGGTPPPIVSPPPPGPSEDPTDTDGDTIVDGDDNCVDVSNEDQTDNDGDGNGDACDNDRDGDGWTNDVDNCADIPNDDQADGDDDHTGDACDQTPDVSPRQTGSCTLIR